MVYPTLAAATAAWLESPYVQKVASSFAKDGGKVAKELPLLRKNYVDEVTSLSKKADDLLKSGMSEEQVARIVSQERRDIGVKYKDLTPEDLRNQYYEQNIKDYGDPLGPTVDWLRDHGKSWSEIIESASRTGGRGLPGTKIE